jgi:hypothetical protein
MPAEASELVTLWVMARSLPLMAPPTVEPVVLFRSAELLPAAPAAFAPGELTVPEEEVSALETPWLAAPWFRVPEEDAPVPEPAPVPLVF